MERSIFSFLGISENVCFSINGTGKYIIIQNELIDTKENAPANFNINELIEADIKIVNKKVTEFEKDIFRKARTFLKHFNARFKSFTIEYNPEFDDEWVSIDYLNDDGSLSQIKTPRFKARKYFYGFERYVDYNIGEVLGTE